MGGGGGGGRGDTQAGSSQGIPFGCKLECKGKKKTAVLCGLEIGTEKCGWVDRRFGVGMGGRDAVSREGRTG